MGRGNRDIIGNSISASVYVITNLTTDRALDCDSTTTAELADIIGNVIRDLQAQGILKGTAIS